QRTLVKRKARFIFLWSRVLAVPAPLTIIFKQEAGDIGIGLGISWPAGKQLSGFNRAARFPTGAQFFHELALETPRMNEVACLLRLAHSWFWMNCMSKFSFNHQLCFFSSPVGAVQHAWLSRSGVVSRFAEKRGRPRRQRNQCQARYSVVHH